MITLADDYWTKIIGTYRQRHEIAALIEQNFLKSEDINVIQNAILDLIKNKPLSQFDIDNSDEFFFKIFLQPEIPKMEEAELKKLHLKVRPEEFDLDSVPELEMAIDSNYGKLSKDYNKYLKTSCFHYPIGEESYRYIFLTLKNNYKRLFFKRAISHLVRYSTSISKETLAIIADICLEQKIGLTLIEITQLMIQNKIIYNEDQFNIVVERLKLFKELADNCEYLARSFCEKNNRNFTVKLIQPHFELLMQHQRYEHFMPIFDRSKEYFTSRKIEIKEGTSTEETVKIQEESKKLNKELLGNFYRDFIKLLNKHKIYKFARLLYNEQSELRLPPHVQDYVNGVYAFSTDTEQVKFFMRKAKEDTMSVEDVTKIGNACLDIFMEKPEDYSKFIEDLVNSLIITKKMTLNQDSINLAITCILKAKLYPEFSRFFTFLLDNPQSTKKNTRMLCYRLLNQSGDDLAKPQLLGLVEKYFKKDIPVEETKTLRKKRSASASPTIKEENTIETKEEESEAKGKKATKGKETSEKPKETKEEAKAEVKTEKLSKKGMRLATKINPDNAFKMQNRRKVKKFNSSQDKFSFLSSELTTGGTDEGPEI